MRPAVFHAPFPVLSSFAFAVVLLKEKIVVGETGDVDGFDVLVEERLEGGDVGPIAGGDEDAAAGATAHPGLAKLGEGDVFALAGREIILVLGDKRKRVDLIKDRNDGLIGATDVG